LAERSGDPAFRAEADHFAGAVSFHLGKFRVARDLLQKSAEAGEYRGHYHSEVYGINMSVFCRAYISHCEWHLGYPRRGLAIAGEAVALARQSSHAFSTALALNYLAMLHQFQRDSEAALEAATEARKICAEHRFDYYGSWAGLVRAWAIAEQGKLDEGFAAYEAALDDFRRTNAGLRRPHYLMMLATLHRKAGKATQALPLVDQAIAIAQASSESWCDAELHRERGELLLLLNGEQADSRADAEFKLALEIAVAQGARLPELRARIARARWHAIRGRPQLARNALAPLQAWSHECLETPDLLDARMLLAALDGRA